MTRGTDPVQRFVTSWVPRAGTTAYLQVPFDPDAVWGTRSRHLLAGTIGGYDWRGEIERVDGVGALCPGPAWFRDRPVDSADVEVVIGPEGPQRDDLDPDIADALAAAPEAAAFFDGLAQFYRRAYLTWIAATRRRPDERVRRIAEVVRLLEAGVKQRPR